MNSSQVEMTEDQDNELEGRNLELSRFNKGKKLKKFADPQRPE